MEAASSAAEIDDFMAMSSMCLGNNADGPERFEAEDEYHGNKPPSSPGILQGLQKRALQDSGSLSRLSRRLRSHLPTRCPAESTRRNRMAR